MNKPTKEEFQTAIKVMEWFIYDMATDKVDWPWWKKIFMDLPIEESYRVMSAWKDELD